MAHQVQYIIIALQIRTYVSYRMMFALFLLACTCNDHMTEFNQPNIFPSIFWTNYLICEIYIHSCEAISCCSYCIFHPLTVYLFDFNIRSQTCCYG
jgi:cytochrome b subunit of formate dehydrogenase